MTPYELFDRCNDTELYQIARAAGLVVLPKATKPELIKYILGDEIPPPVSPDLDEWRLAIMGFVVEHRKQLEVQLRCPAKSMDPRACFQCVDQQVISCLVENSNNLELIRIHKKPIEHQGDPMSATATAVMNTSNAPRDAALIKAAGAFQMRKLAESLGLLSDQAAAMAYGKRSIDERAEDILKALQAKDGGGGTPASTGESTAANGKAPSADAPGASVPAVNPEAFKSAQDATGPGVAKRQPKTEANGKTPVEGELGAVLAAVQAAMVASKDQAASIEKGVAAVLVANKESAELVKKVEGLWTNMAAVLAKQTELILLGINIALTIAEERGVASRADILTDAAQQAELLTSMIKEVTSAGKAA